MNKVFICTGTGRSGKDTFVNFVKQYYPDTLNYSSVDFIKWLSHTYLDIDVKNKTPELRKFLSEFKRILTEYNDYPTKQCLAAIETLEPEQIIFLHIREQEEINKIKEAYPETKVVYVERNIDVVYGNDSDDKCKEINADIVIHNDSDLIDLSKTAKWFVERFILE